MPSNKALPVGEAAPTGIELLNQEGRPVRLDAFRGRNLVVYFYPKDNTPGCTTEGKEFNDLKDDFDALDCRIVGVSVDSVESHRKFAQRHGFCFDLLSDPDGRLAGAFGVLNDGRAARSTFIFDRELRLRRAFEEVRAHGHARQVLDLVRTLLESHRMIGG